MNSTPFSLETTFLAEDASEDKVDLEVSNWMIFGIPADPDAIYDLKHYIGSPPKGQEELAWPNGKTPALHGSFFRRPSRAGKDRNRLLIRQRAVIDPASGRKLEPPLCGGYLFISPSAVPLSITGEPYLPARLRLSLNLQRFIRHQPQKDDPSKPWKYSARNRNEDRSEYRGESSFNGEDNWLPNDDLWNKFSSRRNFATYLELVADEAKGEIERALAVQWTLDRINEDDKSPLELDTELSIWTVEKVETLWEFPSDDPIAEVIKIASMVGPLAKSGTATFKQFEFSKAGHVLNSPCYEISLGAGMRLKFYAKTNKRIRFEVVHTGLRKNQKGLLREAGLGSSNGLDSQEKVESLLKFLRAKAARRMNLLMENLRSGHRPDEQSYPMVKLLAEVAAAVPSSVNKQERQVRIQTVLTWLGYLGGYRRKLAKGPYALALSALNARGVLEYDSSAQFYRLTAPYAKAAHALRAAAENPLLNVFGQPAYQLAPDGKRLIRIRE